MVAIVRDNAKVEVQRMLRRARVPERRSRIEFAEQDLIIPQGTFKGRRYRSHRHPVATLLLRELDHGPWLRAAVTGPVQDGKSFNVVVINTLYHVCEQAYTVVIGGPDENTVKDKWKRDLLPAFKASPRLRALLPRTGPGSKGAFASLIQLRNGGAFRFMTGGGGDESRSAFTAEAAMITEVDKMDQPGSTSRETDKVTQIESRTELYRASGKARVYLECTSSVSEGRITQEIANGSDSSPRLKCQHCDAYVLIERQHLIGWRDAKNEQEARRNAHLVCPGCGAEWTEENRRFAIVNAVLCHKGQTVNADGELEGPPPETVTLGYRWTDADSLFKSMGDLGAMEWAALRAEDRENKEKALTQFHWGRPYVSEEEQIKKLSVSHILRRSAVDERWVRDRVPANRFRTVMGVDVGKWWLHWTYIAIFRDRRRHVIAYDKLQVPSDDMDVPDAIESALAEVQKMCDEGWQLVQADIAEAEAELVEPETVHPDLVLYDARYQTDAVCRYLTAVNQPSVHLAAMGFGIGQENRGQYRQPSERDIESGRVVFVGENYKISPRSDYDVYQVDFDADFHKQRVHEAMRIDTKADGAMTLPYVKHPVEHTGFARQLLAENAERVFRPGYGYVTKMVALKGRPNHHFDSTSMASIGGEICLSAEAEDQAPQEAQPTEPDRAAASVRGNLDPDQFDQRFLNPMLAERN